MVELFIRNDEESDTDATNMVMHITDINSSQAIYVPNSAYVTPPGSVFAQAATPNPLQDIYIGTVGGKEHFSVDYSLDLVSSSINMPIKAELEYTLNLADSSGNLVPIDFITVLNENIPLCTEDNFAYYPDYSIFNVENSVLSATQKYNLPTQTANRAGDFKIVSYDENSVHTRKGASMPVAVEIIDAKHRKAMMILADNEMMEGAPMPFLEIDGEWYREAYDQVMHEGKKVWTVKAGMVVKKIKELCNG